MNSAAYKRPPGRQSTVPNNVSGNRTFTDAVSGSGGSATVKAPCTTLTGGDAAAIPDQGCFITWVFSVDTYLVTGAATDTLVADTNAAPIPAGVHLDWWHTKDDTHWSAIAVGAAAGTAKRWKSNR